NVKQSAEEFAGAGLLQAGSLALFTDRGLQTREVAELLLGQLDEEYDRLCQGDHATLEACWKWHTGLLGKSVVVECHGALHRGRLCEQAFEGLELELMGGERIHILPEMIRHVTPA